MNTQKTASLLSVFGALLILCAGLYFWNDIAPSLVLFFALGAALACFGLAYFMLRRAGWAFMAGLIAVGLLIIFFGWQSVESFYELLDKLQNDALGSPYPKANAFLLTFTMFISALITEIIQIMLARSNSRELTS